MYLLDTNILSELMRAQPNQQVINWLDQQRVQDLYISTITVAEIRLGIGLLPNGKRKRLLTQGATETLQDFDNNILSFDERSAEIYAVVVAQCTQEGRPISVEDAQIASIALTNELVLVTRNVSDFDVVDGLDIFDPFI